MKRLRLFIAVILIMAVSSGNAQTLRQLLDRPIRWIISNYVYFDSTKVSYLRLDSMNVRTHTVIKSIASMVLDKNATDSPSLTFTDEDNKTFTILKLDAGAATLTNDEGAINILPSGDLNDYLSITTVSGIITLTSVANGDGDIKIVSGGGDVWSDDNFWVTAAQKIGFDGIGGHTYLLQSSDDILDTYVGASNIIRLDEANAANSSNSFMTLAGTSPIHASGTPTDIWLDINPTFGLNTATATAHIVDIAFTTPAWTTSGQTNIAKGIYIAPTLGASDDGTNTTTGIDIVGVVTNPTAGTNAFKGINIAGLTGDAQVSVTALDIGNLASAAGLAERAISIGC